MNPLPHPFGRTLAALGGAVLALGLLAGCGDDDTKTAGAAGTPAGDASTAPTSPAASDGASAPTGVPSTGTPSAIPAYYVGKTPQGDRLFREFTQVSGVDKLVAAAAAVTSGGTVDPDYRTLWPQGRFASVAQSADAITVTLEDDAWLQAGSLKPTEAKVAVQQLVYTLQGTIGKRLPVKVEYGGKPAATLLGVDASAGLKAAPELDVLALVNVTEPAQGTVVSGSFTAEGRASSFEATVPWELRDASGKVVKKGFATAEGWADKLYPWSTKVDVKGLTPGSYTFLAKTDDPSDGEGAGPTQDTKQITVK
jgi:hypothetical protein